MNSAFDGQEDETPKSQSGERIALAMSALEALVLAHGGSVTTIGTERQIDGHSYEELPEGKEILNLNGGLQDLVDVYNVLRDHAPAVTTTLAFGSGALLAARSAAKVLREAKSLLKIVSGDSEKRSVVIKADGLEIKVDGTTDVSAVADQFERLHAKKVAGMSRKAREKKSASKVIGDDTGGTVKPNGSER